VALPQALKALLVPFNVTLVVTDVAQLGLKCALVARQISGILRSSRQPRTVKHSSAISVGLLGKHAPAKRSPSWVGYVIMVAVAGFV
jgi:hypothetical protein